MERKITFIHAIKARIAFILLLAFISIPSFSQFKELIKNIKVNDILDVVKEETIKQLEKLKDEYDPTDFNYAVSFSDNSGIFESEDKYRKYQKGILYAVSPESMQNQSEEEKAEDYNDVGELLYASGKYNSAELSFLTARFIHEYNGLTNTVTGARVIANLGLIYHTTGRYAASEEFTRQAMQIQKDILNDMNGYGASINNLAVLNKDIGHFNESEELFRQAIEITRETKGAESSAMAIVKNNRAILLQLLGKYEDAEKVLLEALDIASGSIKQKSPNYVRMKVNLALLYQLQKQYDKAEEIYLDAIQLKKRRMGTGHPDYAVMLRNLASLYMEKGDLAEVEDLLKKAIKIFEKKFGKNHPVYASSLTDLARFYLAQDNASQARPLVLEALEIQKTSLGEHHPSLNTSMETLAVAEWQEGNITEAAAIFKEVMEEYLYQVKTYFPAMSEYDKAKFWNTLYPRFIRYYNFVLDAHNEIASLSSDMYNYHIATKALLLSSTSKLKQQILNGEDETLKKQYIEWVDLKKYLSQVYTLTKDEIIADKINVDSLEYAANELEKQLSAKSKVFSTGFLQDEIKTSDISASLSAGEACVEFIRLPNTNFSHSDSSVNYAAMILDNTVNKNPRLIVFSQGLQMEGEYAVEYRNNMQRGFEKTGQYAAYWGELDAATKEYDKLYVSLDGIYNQINLNTLQDESGKFLADKMDIIYVMNSKMVPSLKRKQLTGIPGRKNALLLGDPDYAKGFDWSKAKKLPLPELPGTRKEVEQINAHLTEKAWKTKLLLGDAALEGEIKKLKKPYLLHIATHGYFLEDRRVGKEKVFGVEPEQALQNPLLRSGLLFTGADNTIQSIGETVKGIEDDGILNAYEALFLDLENTDLVVLSACETGLGEIRNGEGVYGLQRAFQIAGASSLIISLWQVSDVVSQKLMDAFYSRWLATGNKYEALKYARNEIKKNYPAPFYWGAFIMLNN